MLSFQCTLVHHLGCERTFTKVEQMKWHLKSRDHKRFPVILLFGDILVFHIHVKVSFQCFSCESTLAFHTVGALADHVLCTPHHDDELNMRWGRRCGKDNAPTTR